MKRPGLDGAVSRLLDELDMWNHVVSVSSHFRNPRVNFTPVKASLYHDRSEVDPDAIAAVLKRPGRQIIVEEPRFAAPLGRTIAAPSDKPATDKVAAWASSPASRQAESGQTVAELLGVLRDADDWQPVASGVDREAASAERILRRAAAADELARRRVRTTEAFAALEQRVRNRSLHRSWRYCGLDGSAALRALTALEAPQSVELARYCLWRDDPAAEAARPDS